VVKSKAEANAMSDTATMHIDGASRGNPGKAAYAVVLVRPGEPVLEEADTIGTASNNVAEYTALGEGLTLAAELGVKKLNVFSDSELLVKQMNGEYKVKNEDLRGLFEEACRLRRQFEKLTIAHVRREQNKRADAIGNDALDGKPRKRGQPFVELPPPAAPTISRPTPREPKASVGDSAVRADAIQCLADAARHWAASGAAGLPPEAVWEQLWSLLEEAGVLKKKK
jgi:ribonuclease HI